MGKHQVQRVVLQWVQSPAGAAQKSDILWATALERQILSLPLDPEQKAALLEEVLRLLEERP